MGFYYKNIASFTFCLWEILGCHLRHNRFLISRTFWFFSLFVSFFLPCSLLPTLLLSFFFFSHCTCFYLLPSLSLSALSPECLVFKLPQRRSQPIGWSPSRTELLIGLRHRQTAGFASAAPTLLRLAWPITGPCGTKHDSLWQEAFCDPIFQKGAVSVDSDQSVIDAIQTCSHYSHLLIVEHLLNHSNFSNSLIFIHTF